jgi:hypothetical protein
MIYTIRSLIFVLTLSFFLHLFAHLSAVDAQFQPYLLDPALTEQIRAAYKRHSYHVAPTGSLHYGTINFFNNLPYVLKTDGNSYLRILGAQSIINACKDLKTRFVEVPFKRLAFIKQDEGALENIDVISENVVVKYGARSIIDITEEIPLEAFKEFMQVVARVKYKDLHAGNIYYSSALQKFFIIDTEPISFWDPMIDQSFGDALPQNLWESGLKNLRGIFGWHQSHLIVYIDELLQRQPSNFKNS